MPCSGARRLRNLGGCDVDQRKTDRGLALGVGAIAVFTGLYVVSLALGFELPPREGPATVLAGLPNILAGLLFMASYYHEHRSFLFRGLMWVCVHGSNPGGRWMAFLFGPALSAVGIYVVLIGLGVAEGG
jgi:hypothetical protein